MNYIEVIKAVWKWYQSSILEPNDYCLMMRLIAISNDDMGWENCFLRNNYELIGSAKLSYKQLQLSRNKLQQIGLISFDQRNGLANCKYQIHFETLLNLSKKSKGNAKVTARLRQGEGVDKLNLNKTKTKLNIFPDGKPTGKENNNKVLFWDKLVEAWFIFYKKEYLIEPTFNGAAGSQLKQILSRLEKLTKNKGFEWTEEHSVVCLNHFLTKAHKDQWLQRNFLLSNLSSKFDTIVNPKNNGHSNNSKQPTGGQVDTRAAFDAIDRHFT